MEDCEWDRDRGDGLGDVERGESVAPKGCVEIDTPDGVDAEDDEGAAAEDEDEDGDARAAKIELETSEKSNEARFWLFVNLYEHVSSVSR